MLTVAEVAKMHDNALKSPHALIVGAPPAEFIALCDMALKYARAKQYGPVATVYWGDVDRENDVIFEETTRLNENLDGTQLYVLED